MAAKIFLMRAFPLIILVLAVLAGIAGWLATPRYSPPADSGEQRLKQRAVEYYRASRVFDYATMARHFTPARQLERTAELQEEAREKAADYSSMQPETRADLEFSAESIAADRLAVQAEGDWAVVSGDYDIRSTEGGAFTAPLEETVWVRNAGDWWLYTMTPEELNAYGNPPGFARRILKKSELPPIEQLATGQEGGAPGDTK